MLGGVRLKIGTLHLSLHSDSGKGWVSHTMLWLQNRKKAPGLTILLGDMRWRTHFRVKPTETLISIGVKSWQVIVKKNYSQIMLLPWKHSSCFYYLAPPFKDKNPGETFGCLATSFISSCASGMFTGTASFFSSATYLGATGSMTCNQHSPHYSGDFGPPMHTKRQHSTGNWLCLLLHLLILRFIWHCFSNK